MTSLDLYDYDLPEELVAQYPADKRDGSRLLVVNRTKRALEDRYFSDLTQYLMKGDVLVLNDSRVMHARLLGKKRNTGARIEIFLLNPLSGHESESGQWKVLARPARRLSKDDVVDFAEDFSARIIQKESDGSVVVSFEYEGVFLEALDKIGTVPLPPYIKRSVEPLDEQRYQTVYAEETGSAAAPTAGLHFTKGLLEAIRLQGVETAFVTLHVGLGTFRPVQTDTIEEHTMHEEFYHVSESTALAINKAKKEGRRVICVGTTSVRTIESAAARSEDGSIMIEPGWGSTGIFIYPGGRELLVTDALITNFHLPKSTLLMLVSTLYDREGILDSYRHAISENYRFFSYGDAMLIL
jgi:S-adenosylmethionine:tRNA ribosyltransferase-isomerase